MLGDVENLYGLTRADLIRRTGSAARAGVVFHGLYRDRVRRWQEFRQLPAPVLAALRSSTQLRLPSVCSRFASVDRTQRYLLGFEDGEKAEAVYIPSPERTTLCISSQVGCGLGCVFCRTAQLGLIRDLSTAEIVGQVVRLMHEHEAGNQRVSVVFMGMGEPLQNYDNVMRAVEILRDDKGLAIPLTRITVSTAGLIPAIERLAQEEHFPNLSISLTGTHNTSRDALMPINRRYPVEQLMETVRRLPYGRQRRVMFECVLIKDLTDTPDDAHRLAAHVAGMPVKVNLIPFNPSPGIAFERPSMTAVLDYQRVLLDAGIATFIRRNRGDDVSGACGQLRLAEVSSSAVT